MILAVGKPTIEIAELDKDGNVGTWRVVDTPKEGTTDMSTSEGSKTEYTEEGGGLVDSYQQKSKYSLTLDLFAKKGQKKPIPDDNGVITKNYAIRVTPEDKDCLGFIMWRCSVSCVTSYKVTDGIIWKYTFNGLLNDITTQIMEEFTRSQWIDFNANYVVFTSAADSTGQVLTTQDVGAGTTLTVSADAPWITVTSEGCAVTIKVAENTSGKKRIGWVTVSADIDETDDDEESKGLIKVIQSK